MGLKDGKSLLAAKFMSSCEIYDEASVVMVGVPMDYTCSFKPGTRFGPQKIREISVGIEEYSPYSDISLSDINFFDCGDIELPFGNVEGSLKLIGAAAEEILKDNKFPLFIGGEHLISLPVVEEVFKKYGSDLVLLHFDAHADLRDEYIGCKNSHSAVIRRINQFVPGKNIYQFGIRSGSREEIEFGKANTNLFLFNVLEPLRSVLPEIGDKPVYVTLDIDVVDPAFANGTGTPEPGGISSSELMEALKYLKQLNIIGFDIVEISPLYDMSDRTAILAAKVIREIIVSFGKRKQ